MPSKRKPGKNKKPQKPQKPPQTITKPTPAGAAADAASAAESAAEAALAAFSAEAAVVTDRSQPIITQITNLKTIPPLMANPHVMQLNECLSARDAYHDASPIKPHNNNLFKHAQQIMFGRYWASKCEAAINPAPIIISALAALEAMDYAAQATQNANVLITAANADKSDAVKTDAASAANAAAKVADDAAFSSVTAATAVVIAAANAAKVAATAAKAAADMVLHNSDPESKIIRNNALKSKRDMDTLNRYIKTLTAWKFGGTNGQDVIDVLTTLSVGSLGNWLSTPESDIIWTRIQHIKKQGITGSGNVIPRFGITLKPYNLSHCIQGAKGDVDEVNFLQVIVDNSDAGSPLASSPMSIKIKKPQTVRIVPFCECYDRAGRSYSNDRLELLKKWWKVSVTGAMEGLYPPINIPLRYVGEIYIEDSWLTVSLILNDGKTIDFSRLPKSNETIGRAYEVDAALLFQFKIPGITVHGVPGVNDATLTYDTYVFIHSNGSVSYSDSVDGPNYPDNTEKNQFYSSHSTNETVNAVRQAVLYNICKSIGDSGALWCATSSTFVHSSDTGLLARCMLGDRCAVTIIINNMGRHKVLVEPNILDDLFLHGQIPKSPKLNIDDIDHSPKHKPLPFTFSKNVQILRVLRILTPSGLPELPQQRQRLPPGYYKESLIAARMAQIARMAQKVTNGGNKNCIQSGGEYPLKLSSNVCRYFQTLLFSLASFYFSSRSRVDDGGIDDHFALPESKDVIVVFIDDDSTSGVENVVANPFQENAVTKPVVKFISFNELPPRIKEFLTFLNAFVKVFVSNIARITNIEIHPKPRVIPDNPSISSAERDAGTRDNVEMERKLKLIRTIISDIFRNGGDSDSHGDSDSDGDSDGGGDDGIKNVLRKLLRLFLLPSVLLRIDDPAIKQGYLEAYMASSKSSNSDSSSQNFFYFPNAASNVFDIVDNIVGYFGPVFSKSYDDSGIVFEKLPDIFPNVKADVFKALEQFKIDNHLYQMPTQIKFNTHSVTSAKIFDNLCKIINGKPLSDPLNANLKDYIEKRLSTERDKLKVLAAIKMEGEQRGEGGEGNSSLSEQINANIEVTARDNILREFTEEMMNYYVDDEMDDFEKDSMKALINLNDTYGFDVEGNDYLHLNDIVYKIFVQEIMYTGVHIYRVDFLQDFINNIGFNTGQLNYMDNINNALSACDSISNEQLTELKIKGYSLSDIMGLLYALRDKTTESSSEEEVTSVVNGFFGQEVSSLPKVMKTGIGIGSIPSQPITVDRTLVSVGKGGRGGHKIKTRSKYVAKRRVMYKKFVRKYIIKADKRGNRGTQGGKRRGGANVTRRKILKRSRVSNNNATRKNHKKIHKKIHKIHKKKNTNLHYNLHKRHKTLKR